MKEMIPFQADLTAMAIFRCAEAPRKQNLPPASMHHVMKFFGTKQKNRQADDSST
ncbi:hypothetical protein ACFQZT_01615 [Paenibacillus sp. GCM10027628]|uniref:hypothetical protein n=1 Tax=Paenibacillus sp. GCM10027628 TaxID=3273413 RepID=UPI00362DEF4B